MRLSSSCHGEPVTPTRFAVPGLAGSWFMGCSEVLPLDTAARCQSALHTSALAPGPLPRSMKGRAAFVLLLHGNRAHVFTQQRDEFEHVLLAEQTEHFRVDRYDVGTEFCDQRVPGTSDIYGCVAMALAPDPT